MEEDRVVMALNNFHTICRLCLEEGVELQSVYDVLIHSEEKTEEISLLDILKRHCNLEISPTDEKPQQVCKSCIILVTESYTFFRNCVQTDELLDTILSESKTLNMDSKRESDPNSTEWVQSKDHQLYSIQSEEDPPIGGQCDDDSDWEPLKVEEIKIEVASEEEQESSEDKVEAESQPTGKRKRGSPEHLQIPIKKRGRPTKNQTSEFRIVSSDVMKWQSKKLVCRICRELLLDVNTSIDHYDELHASELEVDECILCIRPKQYKNRDNLIYHMGLHSKDSMKCIPCRKYFRTKDLLAEHLNECFNADIITLRAERERAKDNGLKSQGVLNEPHNGQLSQKVLKLTQYDGAFTCQLCNENLGEIESVIAHYEKSHLDDPTCLLCLRQFTKQVPLFHIGFHSKKSHVCRPCRLFFRTKAELEDHYVKYDHDKCLDCKICGKKFTRKYKKNEHMLSHIKEKKYSCKKCGKRFTYRTSLERHVRVHFGDRFLCSSCGNVYTTKFMLQRHIRVMHTNVDKDGNRLPKPPPKPLKIQCEYCGDIFTNKYGYGRHIRRHPEFKEFKCKVCSFTCDSRDQLEIHTEDKHKKHSCDVCGKRFSFESELKTHHLRHEDTENARFRCNICGKTARSQAQLKVHHRTHTGERPFTCDICEKSFKQTAHLKVHMFQHTGNKPFKCKLCEKSFPFQQVMDVHMRTHTGEKPFECKHCGNAYHDRTTLQKHHKKKHPEIPIEKAARSEYKVAALP